MKKETDIKKEVAEHRIEVRLTKIQYKILKSLGGASAVLKQVIDEKAGNKEKLLNLRARKQQEIKEIESLIEEYDEKAAEELRQRQEAEQKHRRTQTLRKPPSELSQKERAKFIEQTKKRWKAYLKSGESVKLSENNYNYVMEIMGFKTKDEVDAWLRS